MKPVDAEDGGLENKITLAYTLYFQPVNAVYNTRVIKASTMSRCSTIKYI